MEGEARIHRAFVFNFKSPSSAFLLLTVAGIVVLSLHVTREAVFPFGSVSEEPLEGSCCSQLDSPRKEIKSIVEFGGVGDGKTSNTAAFRRAIEHMANFAGRGGAQLTVPAGRWVTGSFNLTSDFTLFLEDGAVILGSQDPQEWPIIAPLPSYGRGRERLGGRHISLIHGNSLRNVVITGHNGTIDGQGKWWWDLWWNKTLEHTRGHLVELMYSDNVVISNLTFLNSPFWTVHPVYCSNVVIKNMTILAPLNAPNTDGIDPDSSTNVCIEDCYIESGDDLVAIKSGWDRYGIAMARPSINITVRRVSGTTPTCSGIGIGSEMSGGIRDVVIEDMYVRDSAAGIRIKTDQGRGGYITNVTIRNIMMERVKVPIRFSRGSNDHPDERWDPNALPRVKGVFISDVMSLNSRKAPQLEGIEGATFEDICLTNVSILGLSSSSPSSLRWNCKFVEGFSSGVSPIPCAELQKNGSSSFCSIGR
ncbi:probable polygalacturonase [Andrographis paniculata]|uniref:probable polygalacturonase n=1 Tax=Andrographis paniculata TaxID=175694 RepID=UPI0021E8ABD0|nr:probable polygalacturonase [Andrographis paniculata]